MTLLIYENVDKRDDLKRKFKKYVMKSFTVLIHLI
jgi:hypothetical protein